MFSVEVRDRIMIGHSLPDPFFGPAQNMHGATFVVDVAFFRETLTKQNVVVDIGAALDVLNRTLKPLNYQNLDSSFVQLDGQPNPAVINAIDCNPGSPNQVTWAWRKLNRRDPNDECMFLEDPWTADWQTGPHTITFTYRDADSLGRVFLTNDPNYVPTNAD